MDLELLRLEKFNIIGKIKALKGQRRYEEKIKFLQKRTREIDKEIKRCLREVFGQD